MGREQNWVEKYVGCSVLTDVAKEKEEEKEEVMVDESEEMEGEKKQEKEEEEEVTNEQILHFVE